MRYSAKRRRRRKQTEATSDRHARQSAQASGLALRKLRTHRHHADDSRGLQTLRQHSRAASLLERFTVAELKLWADRKMRAADLRLTEVLAADTRP